MYTLDNVEEISLMKKVVIIIAVIALLGILGGIFLARVPGTSSEAEEILKEKGYKYSDYTYDKFKEMVYSFKEPINGEDGELYYEVKYVYVNKLIEGNKDGDYIELYYFNSAEEADKCYSEIKVVDILFDTIGKVENLVYIGNKQEKTEAIVELLSADLKDTDLAEKVLKENGYEINVKTKREYDEVAYGFSTETREIIDNNPATVYDTKWIKVGKLIKGDKNSNHVELYYFNSIEEADRCYSKIKEANKDCSIGRVKNLIYVGNTKEAIEDIAECWDASLIIPLEKEDEDKDKEEDAKQDGNKNDAEQ